MRSFMPGTPTTTRAVPFEKDEWLSGVLTFGEGDEAPAVTVTVRGAIGQTVVLHG